MALGFSELFGQLKKGIVAKGGGSVVGVDVGSSSVKVVQLHNNRGIPTLDTYGELQLGPYGELDIGRSVNLKVPKLAQALVDIIRESSVETKDVALSISYNSSFATVIPVPTGNLDELSGRVPVEAKKYVPAPINTVSLDWFPVGQNKEQTMTSVLVAAIHNDALKRYQTVVAKAGLNMLLTEIEIFSTIRSSVSRKDGDVAIIDFGAGGTRMYIARDGIITKTHSLLLSSAELTEILASVLKIDFRDAEELKRGDVRDNSQGYQALMDRIETGLRELKQVLNRYEERQGEVSKIILTGGGSLLSGLDTYVQDVFLKPVAHAEPFSKIAYPAFLEDTLREAGPSFSVAIGVALQRLVQRK